MLGVVGLLFGGFGFLVWSSFRAAERRAAGSGPES